MESRTCDIIILSKNIPSHMKKTHALKLYLAHMCRCSILDYTLADLHAVVMQAVLDYLSSISTKAYERDLIAQYDLALCKAFDRDRKQFITQEDYINAWLTAFKYCYVRSPKTMHYISGFNANNVRLAENTVKTVLGL